jgi:hypothetical protein
MPKVDPTWRAFEKAVAQFVQALDPTAKVTHDQHLPDRRHGGRRQRDVWIEARLLGHYPVSVLVSCKRTRRPLHSGDVDAFSGELASTQARVGVLYSYSGFSEPAVEKAKQLCISCCRLYSNEAPEIPEVLHLTAYCCKAQLRVRLAEWPLHGWEVVTWEGLFKLQLGSSSDRRSAMSEIVRKYREAEGNAVEAVRGTGAVPQPFAAEIVLRSDVQGVEPIVVCISGRWAFYAARLDAYRVSGSYEFTRPDFKGEVAIPPIDRLSAEPGPGWARVDSPPSSIRNTILVILHGADAEQALVEFLGPRALST